MSQCSVCTRSADKPLTAYVWGMMLGLRVRVGREIFLDFAQNGVCEATQQVRGQRWEAMPVMAKKIWAFSKSNRKN